MKQLPLKLTKLRKHYHYSQDYVAKEMGVDVFEYMAYENGRKIPSFNQLLILAHFYKIDVEQLKSDTQDIDLHRVLFKFEDIISLIKKYQRFIYVFIGVVLGLFLLSFIFKPKVKVLKNLSPVIAKVSAANTFLIYLDENKVAKGSGDNSNGQLDLEHIKDILKLKTGETFSVILKKDGTVETVGLLSKYAKEVSLWKDIVDIEVGKAHIVALKSNGDVYCVGDNFYDQCNFNITKAEAIFARNNASLIKKDGMIKVFGDFNYKNEIEKIRNIKDIDFNDDIVAYINENNEVAYFSKQSFDLNEFKNINKVVVGDGFIAGLFEDEVKIAIDNYLIADEVKKWKVEDIASGNDYLIGYNQGKIIGVGNNKYNQFQKAEKDLQQLPNVENIKIDLLENDIKISFDKLRLADYYQVELDVGIGLNIRTELNEVYIPYLKLKENDDYTIRVTAFSKNQNFLKSNTSFFRWTFIKPIIDLKDNEVIDQPLDNEVIVIEAPFKIENLLGKTVSNFEVYLQGLGIKEDNITKRQSTQLCASELKEAIVVMVSGLFGGEEVRSSDLIERKVEYEYCKIE